MCGVAMYNDMESIKKRERTIKSKEIDSFVNMWSIKWREKQAESEKERKEENHIKLSISRLKGDYLLCTLQYRS